MKVKEETLLIRAWYNTFFLNDRFPCTGLTGLGIAVDSQSANSFKLEEQGCNVAAGFTQSEKQSN
ncbi:hypothetical protein DPMN_076806 [Dreissena polymorpha]|uniref:Uncharacterized protein n=1 Tax=Dreissena polymorpha TaxID=45954 RepID=A0A9D3YN06_DREPO|nr:hypothetical protein DPMN_076806 [Dreissena polymorpha]